MSADEITSARSGIPPILKCPFEIRLMIYRHLIPSIDPSADFNWTSAWDPNRPKSRCEEHKLYSPPILHTNQMIYREVLNELYCFLPYRTSISNYGIRFLGYTFIKPPPAFHPAWRPPAQMDNCVGYKLVSRLACSVSKQIGESKGSLQNVGEESLPIKEEPSSSKSIRHQKIDRERYFEFQSKCFEFVCGTTRGILGYSSRVSEPVGERGDGSLQSLAKAIEYECNSYVPPR